MRAAISALLAVLIAATTPLERTVTKILVTREVRRWLIWLLELFREFCDWWLSC